MSENGNNFNTLASLSDRQRRNANSSSTYSIYDNILWSMPPALPPKTHRANKQSLNPSPRASTIIKSLTEIPSSEEDLSSPPERNFHSSLPFSPISSPTSSNISPASEVIPSESESLLDDHNKKPRSFLDGLKENEKEKRYSNPPLPDVRKYFSFDDVNIRRNTRQEEQQPVRSKSTLLPTIPNNNPRSSHSTLVTLEEIAPKSNQLIDSDEKPPLLDFLKIQREMREATTGNKLPKNLRRYYKQQDIEIQGFEEISTMGEEGSARRHDDAQLPAKITFAVNIVLLIVKVIASVLSGSLSVISSLADSLVDLVSGVVIWFTSRSIKMTNFYEYPVGRTRLEPIGIVILSVIMAITCVQLIIQSIQAIVNVSAYPDVGPVTIVIIVLTILSKAALFFYCRRSSSPSVLALATDHRNDVLSNSVALIFGYIGSVLWVYADPIGAIVISLYIIVSWWQVGRQQIKELSGQAAQPELLQKLLWVCMHHDKRIQYIDTLRAYHFGNNLIVEADIVLDAKMTLQEAHDIGEPLQQRLEAFKEVERAFVHIDYEYDHRPEYEHKMSPGNYSVNI